MTEPEGVGNPLRKSSHSGVLLPSTLVVFAVLAIVCAADIQLNRAGNQNDPGPRFFPILLASGVLGWGIIEMVRSTYSWIRTGRNETMARQHAPWSKLLKTHGKTILFVVFMTFYLWFMPWIGFTISTAVLSAGLLIMFGTRWIYSIAIAVVMVFVVQLLFATLFKVQLPAGELGLPF